MGVNKVASGTAWLTFMQVTNYTISFLFYSILARILSKTDVGILAGLLSVMAVYNTLTMLALNSAAIKLVSEHRARGEESLVSSATRQILKLILVISIPALIVSYALAPIIAGWLNVDVWSCIAILSTAFIFNLTSIYGGIMFGLGLFKHVAFQNMIYTMTSRLPAIFLVYVGLRLFGVATGFMFGSIVCLIFSLSILRGRLIKSSEKYGLKKIVSFSSPLYVNNMIGLAQGWLDIIILNIVAGAEVTAPYYLAVTSSGFLSILWLPLSSTLLPTFTSIFSSGGRKSLEDALALSSRIVMVLVLPVSFALAAVSSTAVSIAYGSSYNQAAIPFAMLAASTLISAYSSLYATSLQALGQTKPIFMSGILSTVAYVIFLAVLSSLLGPVGMAISRVALAAVCLLILRDAVRNHLALKFDRTLMLKVSSISFIIFGCLALIEFSIDSSILTKAFFDFIVFFSIAIISLKLIKPLSIDEVDIVVGALPSKLKFLKRLF